VIPTVAPTRLAATYPTVRVRGRRIMRTEGQTIRWEVLDAATVEMMGREQVGWFVGGHPGFQRATDQLGRLDANPEGGVWIVAPVGRPLSCELYALWPHQQFVSRPPTEHNSVWQSRKVWVAIPEDLKQLLPAARALEAGVAGVILLDPGCILFQSRGGTDSWGHFHRNDRPRHVVEFRASLAVDDWQPPLLVLTERPAMAVAPDVVARAFCLEAFQFIAGDSFGCWDTPIDSA